MENKSGLRKRKRSRDSPLNMSNEERMKLVDDNTVRMSQSDSEVRIVLLGKTGSGKSATGNTILRRDVLKVEASSQSVTRKSQRVCCNVAEKGIWVIDTPGLSDTHMSMTDTEAELIKALKFAYPGPHVFLLVLRLDVKFTDEEKKAVEWLEENFGEEIRKYIIVLFTHGAKLKQKTIEEYLEAGPELKRLVNRMADYHVFENYKNDGEVQVRQLMEKIGKMRNSNENQIYTIGMYEQAQEKLQNKYMKYAGVGGGVTGGGIGAVAVSTAVGAAKAGTVAAAVAAGGVVIAGIAAGAVAVAYFRKRKRIEEKTK